MALVRQPQLSHTQLQAALENAVLSCSRGKCGAHATYIVFHKSKKCTEGLTKIFFNGKYDRSDSISSLLHSLIVFKPFKKVTFNKVTFQLGFFNPARILLFDLIRKI